MMTRGMVRGIGRVGRRGTTEEGKGMGIRIGQGMVELSDRGSGFYRYEIMTKMMRFESKLNICICHPKIPSRDPLLADRSLTVLFKQGTAIDR